MLIKCFDTLRGGYAFVEKQLQAAPHQHPALEVLLVRSGVVEVTIEDVPVKITSGCVLAPNVSHRIQAEEAECEIWILERSLASVVAIHPVFERLSGLSMVELTTKERSDFKEELLEQLMMSALYPPGFDSRVKACIEHIRSKIGHESIDRTVLSAHVHLSPDRLSHLFKAQMGISLSNFMIWERLKYAISKSLEQEINLLNAAYLAGFYDAAHFSRAYLKMFGVNPSSGYNSSTVQI